MSDTIESENDTETVQVYPARDWYFTFGHGQEHFGQFLTIFGTFQEARAEMFRRYGRAWSTQYESAEEAQVAKWSLTHLSHYIAAKETK